MPPVVQVQVQRAPGDCGICALAMLIGVSYEDVFGAASKIIKHARVHHRGLFTREMRSIAKALGVTLSLHRGFDLETDEGILTLTHRAGDHAVLLKAGLIFDGDGTVWEPDVYFSASKYRPMALLVRDE